jgi:uncharacterized protein DUF4112
MTTTTRMQPLFEALKESGPNAADSVARISLLAHVLDSAITIPGTNRTIGIDPLLGLIPVIGDAISAALSSYIVWEAKQLGLPSWKLARMIGNVAVDTVVGGAVPRRSLRRRVQVEPPQPAHRPRPPRADRPPHPEGDRRDRGAGG